MAANSELSLRHQLLKIESPSILGKALESLDNLESARREVAASAGNPDQLNRALQQLERVFHEITKVPGQRNPGLTYGGRTLVYEDCQRDLSLKITAEFLQPVVPALSLLLKSLRWLMQSTGLAFVTIFRQVYEELAAARGAKER